MKKIIAAFDGLKYSESTASYAIDLAKKYNGKIFGIFLEDYTYHSYSIADLVGEEHADEEKAVYLRKRDAELRADSITLFRSACENEGIQYSIHRDRNIAIRELINETLYADLVVVQNDETFSLYAEKPPSNFVITLLEKSECPVVVVPSVFSPIKNVIFLYDGKPSSIYAIKQFGGVLPAVKSVSTELVYVRPQEENYDNSLPNALYVTEWVKLNYPDLQYHVLIGTTTEQIANFLTSQTRNSLVVLGAYTRGSLSRLIHQSMADTIIQRLNLPLFISHK